MNVITIEKGLLKEFIRELNILQNLLNDFSNIEIVPIQDSNYVEIHIG